MSKRSRRSIRNTTGVGTYPVATTISGWSREEWQLLAAWFSAFYYEGVFAFQDTHVETSHRWWFDHCANPVAWQRRIWNIPPPTISQSQWCLINSDLKHQGERLVLADYSGLSIVIRRLLVSMTLIHFWPLRSGISSSVFTFIDGSW